MRKILITGGLGFIGSVLMRRLAAADLEVLCLDAGTYAADSRRIPPEVLSGIRVFDLDVADPEVSEVMTRERPDVVVHMAAESHVTRSESSESSFFRTNVEGTSNLLGSAESAGIGLTLHVSTDEVYGPASGHPFREDEKEPGEGRATSPYARSKALADDLALSFSDRIPLIVARPTNCFGPWQHPEKAIPRWITRALKGRDLPVWGDGGYIRDWLFVQDACSALELLIERGEPGGVYNIAPSQEEITNLELARSVALLAGRSAESVYLTSYDRPQHDRRYAINAAKLRMLGWQPEKAFPDALEETVRWYAENEWWWQSLVRDAEALYDDDNRRLEVEVETE